MHVEPARRFRNIPAAQFIDALNVLPPHAVCRHRIFRRLDLLVVERKQRRDHVVGIDRLGEIVDGAELNGVHGGRDVTVAGEDDGAGLGTALFHGGNNIQPVAVAKPHVDHRESRGRLVHLQQAFGDQLGRRDDEAPRFHRAREPLKE